MTESAQELFPGRTAFDIDAVAERCEQMRRAALGRPFAPQAMAFLGAVSARLLGREIRLKHPQLAALGFWMRPGVLARLAVHYQSRADKDDAVLVPRGLVFHLPPANVDVLFAYSWFLSVLAGNANIIRLPSSLNDAAQVLLDAVVHEADRFPEIRSSSLIAQYTHSASANRVISSQCDVRAVWGGDAKILELRTVALPPRAIQIEFADRFSYAAFKADAYHALAEAERTAVAERLFNDLFWFDQMGCASPRVIFWVGDKAAAKAVSKDLFSRMLQVIAQKGYSVDASTAVAKMSYADRFALDLPVEGVERLSNELTVLTLAEPVDFRDNIMGAGVVAVSFVRSLVDLASFVKPKDQTLVQFGFKREEIQELIAKTRGRGLDRVVPVGRALDFHHLWDGFDLIASFCRLVHLA